MKQQFIYGTYNLMQSARQVINQGSQNSYEEWNWQSYSSSSYQDAWSENQTFCVVDIRIWLLEGGFCLFVYQQEQKQNVPNTPMEPSTLILN